MSNVLQQVNEINSVFEDLKSIGPDFRLLSKEFEMERLSSMEKMTMLDSAMDTMKDFERDLDDRIKWAFENLQKLKLNIDEHTNILSHVNGELMTMGAKKSEGDDQGDEDEEDANMESDKKRINRRASLRRMSVDSDNSN
mmetsp:Transcript_111934/g.241364  ORF Transcript_111934/g.241364 Transcript_111934/m.241364 type:complete len:140 (+) Transcript_111934:266-685(+)